MSTSNPTDIQMLNMMYGAGTGTGKTVVAAFDYQRLMREEGSPPRLLFIAHRIQILKQAIETFRHSTF